MDDFRYVLKFHKHRTYMFNVIDCTKKGEFTVLIMLDEHANIDDIISEFNDVYKRYKIINYKILKKRKDKLNRIEYIITFYYI